jgi:hypothetical protein
MNPMIEELTAAVEREARKRPEALRLMTPPGVSPTTALHHWYRASDTIKLSGDCLFSLPVDLEDSAPGSPLRGARPRSKQEVDTKPHNEDDPATPKSRLPGRTSDFSNRQSSVIFEPGLVPVVIITSLLDQK